MMAGMVQPRTSALVLGLGRTGLSCARFLAAHGVAVEVVDDQHQPPLLARLAREVPEARVRTGAAATHGLGDAQYLVVSPGVPLDHPLLRSAASRQLEVMGDIELFARHARAPVVAVTGSNGKSTVTVLLGEMARAAGSEVRVGGNLGTPALDLIGPVEPACYVLELSSFQLATTVSLAPVAAVVLNLSADHLDRHGSLADYAAAKGRIYRQAGLQLVNRDDPAAAALASPDRPQVSFGLDAPPRAEDYGIRMHQGEPWLARGEILLLPARALRLPGRHNQANALAALALGEVLGLPLEAMLGTLRRFPGLPHRTQWVAETGGVNWYDDSKGTNVGATLAAVQGFEQPLVLILGGQGKGADFGPLRAVLPGRVRQVLLLGEDAPRIEAALAGSVPLQRVASMEQAVAVAARLARPGDAVLLSPACASFDMFSGYEERGRVFARAVEALGR